MRKIDRFAQVKTHLFYANKMINIKLSFRTWLFGCGSNCSKMQKKRKNQFWYRVQFTDLISQSIKLESLMLALVNCATRSR